MKRGQKLSRPRRRAARAAGRQRQSLVFYLRSARGMAVVSRLAAVHGLSPLPGESWRKLRGRIIGQMRQFPVMIAFGLPFSPWGDDGLGTR